MQKRYFDLHTDTASVMFDQGKSLAENDLHVDLKRAEKFEYVPFMTLFSDCSRMDMTGRYEALMENRAKETAGRVAFVTTGKEYEEAKKAGLRPALHAVEGAEMLLCSLEKLEKAILEDKLVMSGISWNNPNALYTASGLTDLGRDYVGMLNKYHVAADVSHLNDACAREVIELADRVVASHSNARALCDVRRDLPDDLIRMIGEKKGLIGLNFYTEFISPEKDKQTFDFLARHASRIAELAGVETLAIGSDLDGCILPSDMKGVEDMPLFDAALERAGFSEKEIDDICFENAFAYFLK